MVVQNPSRQLGVRLQQSFEALGRFLVWKMMRALVAARMEVDQLLLPHDSSGL